MMHRSASLSLAAALLAFLMSGASQLPSSNHGALAHSALQLVLAQSTGPQNAGQSAPPKKSKLDEEEEEEPPKKPAAKPGANTQSSGGAQSDNTGATSKPKPKLDEEEEEVPGKKPSTSPPKSKLDEEEEAPKKPSTPPKNFGEEEEMPKPRTSSGTKAGRDEGEEEADPEERLFDTASIGDQAIRMRLYPKALTFPLAPDLAKQTFTFERLVSNKEGRLPQKAAGKDLRNIEYYEERMWTRAAAELGLPPKQLIAAGAKLNLADPKLAKPIAKAKRILIAALTEHDLAVEQNLRQGLGWERFRQPLFQALVNIKLGELDALIDSGRLQQAEVDADRLLAELKATGADVVPVRTRFERIFLAQAEQALAEQNYEGARALLAQMADRFPIDLGTAGRKFRDKLIAAASDRVREAESIATTQQLRALALLDDAAKIWPELPGLQDRKVKLAGAYPVLNCAYPEMPVNFSPLLARSAVERHAVGLMFESLVRWLPDDEAGAHYECQLAQGRPVPLSRGRQFYLRPCRWSDWSEEEPHLCTIDDIRATVSLLQNKNVPGHLPAWTALVKGVLSTPSNPFVADIELSRDHWQPLSLMDFKVLPTHIFNGGDVRARLAEFNRNPVGTGPYQLDVSRRQEDQVWFTANPHYRTPGRPIIREIVFHRLDATRAAEQFLQGQVQLIHGLGPEQVTQLQKLGKNVQKISTPSVWFLAPNYAHAGANPLKNQDLRLAIAHGIDRDLLLKQYFRPGSGPNDHASLTGPFPRRLGGDKVWAYNETVPAFDTNKAVAHANIAKQQLGNIPPLRLVYPASDIPAENACKQIKEQLAKLGITIELVDVHPDKFYTRIVDDHDFDLVYWRHDFEDETYWLWPLFDPQAKGRGGANFMGIDPDDQLAGMFHDMELHKRFPEIRKLTHDVHNHIARTAAIIPLWQLDTYVAVGSQLQHVKLDPLTLFGDVQEWTLNLKAKP